MRGVDGTCLFLSLDSTATGGGAQDAPRVARPPPSNSTACRIARRSTTGRHGKTTSQVGYPAPVLSRRTSCTTKSASRGAAAGTSQPAGKEAPSLSLTLSIVQHRQVYESSPLFQPLDCLLACATTQTQLFGPNCLSLAVTPAGMASQLRTCTCKACLLMPCRRGPPSKTAPAFAS